MNPRATQWLARVVACALSATAAAADAPAPAAPAPAPPPKKASEPAPAPPPAVDPKAFDEALGLYFAGKANQAAPKLYAFVEGAPQTDENQPWAQYFLGRAFLDLGLRHAAAVYFAKVARERSNPQVVPHALVALQNLTEGPHDERMVDEEVFGSLDLGFLPDDVAGFVHYQQGLVDLQKGNERWANNHFFKLPEGTAEASRARFAVLVTRLRRVRGEVSTDLVDQFLELSKDLKLTQETRNEAALAVARLRYERKDYPGALEAYAQVKLPPLDPGRATLYLEEAWTRYRVGQLHAAMGILTTLDAPSFRDEFLPDKYLLRAFVFKDLCHYLPAKRAAKELTRRYADSLEAVRERTDLVEDPRLRRAAAAQGPTRRAQRFVDALQQEGERLGRYAGSFGDRLYTHLSTLYALAHAEASRVLSGRLEEAVREQADRLLRAAEQVRLMEYEVGLKLYERVKRGQRPPDDVEEPALEPSQVAFRFDGEYWNDELRDYRVSLHSRCLKEEAP